MKENPAEQLRESVDEVYRLESRRILATLNRLLGDFDLPAKGDTTMRFMMMMIPRVYQPDTPPGEKAGEGFAPPAEAVAKMMKFNEELAKAGALIALDGLHPGSKGARIAFSGGKTNVTDGSFTEAKEVIGGYWMIEAKSKEEAVGWARRCPASDGDVIEVRQVFEMSDFPLDVREAADSPTVKARIEQRKAS